MPSLEDVLVALVSPFADLASPASRHFGPALLVALALAVLVWWRGPRDRSLTQYLFPREVWLHRSAKLDYQLLLARPLVRLFLLGPFVVSSLFVAARVVIALRGWLGPGPLAGTSPAVVVATFTLAAFVVEDLVRFLLHVASHRVPVLWALHRVHHTAEVMTPLSVHRVHPLESVLNRAGVAVAMGLVAGVCSWLFDGPISGWTILGVDALGLVWNLAGGALRHSEIPLRYPRSLEHVLVSPAQHQIHHGDRPEQYHRNYGSTFALWDWALGSLVTSEHREGVRYGLPAALKNHGDDALSAMLGPLREIASMLVPRRARRRARVSRPRGETSPQPAGAVVREGLLDLLFRAHHERAAAGDRLAERAGGGDEDAGALAARADLEPRSGVEDGDVIRGHSGRTALGPHLDLARGDVDEGVVIARDLDDERGLVVQDCGEDHGLGAAWLDRAGHAEHLAGDRAQDSARR